MINVTTNNEIAIIEFAYGKVNAIDIEFCQSLSATLNELTEQSASQTIIISSSGRAFSAGIDLKRWLAEGPEYVRPFMVALEDLFEQLFCYPAPVIADINGSAIAGGCMLALACDYRVIETEAAIGILESRLGVPLPTMAIEIMRHTALPAVFRQIISTGATFTGSQAVDAGLANEVISSKAATRTQSLAAAEEFGQLASQAFQLTKAQRTQPVMRIVRQNQSELFDDYIRIWESQETRDAIETYVENRLN